MMRKTLAILVFFSGSALAATPTIVQSTGTSASVGNVVASSFTSTVTAGNRVYTCISVNIGATVNTPTMAGETFVLISGMSQKPAANAQLQCYEIASAAGGATKVQENGTGGAGFGWNIISIEVNCGGACTDETVGKAAATCSPTCSVSTAGSGTSGDLVLSFFASDQADETWTAGSGTAVFTAHDNDGNDQFAQKQTAGSTGTQTATASLSTSGDQGTDGIVAILGAAASTGVSPSMGLMGVGGRL